MTECGTVLVEQVDGVCRITLNRPDKLNAFNGAMHTAFYAALDAAGRDEAVRAVLLTGAGRAFCAGQDLGDRDPARQASAPDLGAMLDRTYNPLIRRLRSLDKPVVCAVNGVAAGRGRAWRWPATSSWRHARPGSSRPSAGSAWYRIPGRPGPCRI